MSAISLTHFLHFRIFWLGTCLYGTLNPSVFLVAISSLVLTEYGSYDSPVYCLDIYDMCLSPPSSSRFVTTPPLVFSVPQYPPIPNLSKIQIVLMFCQALPVCRIGRDSIPELPCLNSSVYYSISIEYNSMHYSMLQFSALIFSAVDYKSVHCS